MKSKVLAVLTVAGVLGVTGAAFADVNLNINIDAVKYRPIAQAQPQRMPEPPKDDFQGHKPPMPPKMSRDMKGRPPEPPKDDKHQPMSRDKRPPLHSRDKRPPEMPRR